MNIFPNAEPFPHPKELNQNDVGHLFIKDMQDF